MTILAVALAGAAGAISRFVLDGAVRAASKGAFPWGTFTINTSGSFALGVITGAAMYHGFGGTPRLAVASGFCGAYTTFSGWVLETVELVDERRGRLAVANVLMSVAAGSAAAAVGLAVAAL